LAKWPSDTPELVLAGSARKCFRKVKSMNQTIGKRFPDIELPDQDGQVVKLSELVGKFPFILSFYRGYW